jgi:hypothetical protein
MGHAAREYVGRHHSVAKHIAAVNDIYRDAVAVAQTPHAAAV